MRAPKSPFESYKSKRILFFASFIFSSVPGPKVLEKQVYVLPYSIAVKSYRTFSVQGKFTTVNLLVKFIHESPKNPCVLQCIQGAKGGELIFL